jgi:hypothetical protein
VVHCVPFLEQPLVDELGHSFVVFDEENFHAGSGAQAATQCRRRPATAHPVISCKAT